MRTDAKFVRSAMVAAAMTLMLTAAVQAKVLELHVATASVSTSTSGQAIVDVTVTPESAEVLRDFTRQQLGKAVEVRVAGEVVMSPVVTHEIANGHFQITGTFRMAEAQTILKRLSETGAAVEVEPRASPK